MGMIIRTSTSRGPSYGDQHEASAIPSPAEESARIIDEAKRHASQLVEQAERTASEVVAVAEQHGQSLMEQAQRDADAMLQGEVAAGRDLLARCAEKSVEVARAIAISTEDRLLEMSMAIAERILRKSLSQPSDLAVRLVRESVEMVAGANTLKVLISPLDYERHEDRIQAVLAELRPGGRVEIQVDDLLTAGDCRIESEFGSIDQSINAQLDRIAEELAIPGLARRAG